MEPRNIGTARFLFVVLGSQTRGWVLPVATSTPCPGTAWRLPPQPCCRVRGGLIVGEAWRGGSPSSANWSRTKARVLFFEVRPLGLVHSFSCELSPREAAKTRRAGGQDRVGSSPRVPAQGARRLPRGEWDCSHGSLLCCFVLIFHQRPRRCRHRGALHPPGGHRLGTWAAPRGAVGSPQ